MPVVTDADLSAPQRLPKLPGFWWKPEDWQAVGTGRFVAPFDPLAEDAAYLAEVVFGTLHGWPVVGDPEACIDQYARELGGRAAKSLRWRSKLPVAEGALVSTYREFLTRCLLGANPQTNPPADVIDMSGFKAARRAEQVAASRVERAAIARELRAEGNGQIAAVF